MGLRIDHVGIVVSDLDRAMASYRGLLDLPESARTVSTVTDPETGEQIDVGFFQIGANRLEFICPRPGSVSRFAEHLQRHGEGIYHVSVYLDDFAGAVDRLRGEGAGVDPLTVVMTPPAATVPGAEPDGAPTRVVQIAWIPTALTHGVNLELVDGRA